MLGLARNVYITEYVHNNAMEIIGIEQSNSKYYHMIQTKEVR